MKLYLGLLESSLPDQTRIFGELDGQLVDLQVAGAAYLTQAPGNQANAYELAGYRFPRTITAFLERDEPAQKSLDEVVAFVRRSGVSALRGPAGVERCAAQDVRRPAADARRLSPAMEMNIA